MPSRRSTKKTKNVSITVSLDFPTEQILNSQTVNELGQAIKDESIRQMDAGISPVNGRKFQLYKNTDKYPENVRKTYPDKRNTPVNLKLSGDLHDSLSWKKSGDKGFLFGLISPKGRAADYGEAHNEGLGNLPERRFLPTGPGELFNKSIMLEIRQIIVDRISRLIK